MVDPSEHGKPLEPPDPPWVIVGPPEPRPGLRRVFRFMAILATSVVLGFIAWMAVDISAYNGTTGVPSDTQTMGIIVFVVLELGKALLGRKTAII